MRDFDGKVAVITGGATGIGRAACLLFAELGAKVVVADVDTAQGQETVLKIEAAGGAAIFVETDVSNSMSVKNLMDTAVQSFGRVNCAFNNAGIIDARDHEWDEAVFNKTIGINLNGVMFCMKHQIDHMLEMGGGSIVNTSSTGGLIAAEKPSSPAYVASKHGVIGLTKTAALAYARRNVRVNAICPGITRTSMVETVMARSPEVKAALEATSPMGRIADPREIAEAAVWLCSDRASFVTGHSLVVDGGFLAQ